MWKHFQHPTAFASAGGIRQASDVASYHRRLTTAVRNLTVPRLSITIPPELDDRLAELSGESGPYESKADAVRELTRSGERLPEVERERDALRDQLAATNARADDVGELVEYVEEERRIQRRREERERERESAPVWRRAAWWVFGRS